MDFDGTYVASQVYSRYEKEILLAAGRGTLKADLAWLLPCFAEDVTRVLEREVGVAWYGMVWYGKVKIAM